MILFTQSTAVLLNDELKILRLLQCFPAVAQNSQNSLCFPCSEKSQVFKVCDHPVIISQLTTALRSCSTGGLQLTGGEKILRAVCNYNLLNLAEMMQQI